MDGSVDGALNDKSQEKIGAKKLNNLIQPLKSGIPVMLFPEGTRSLDGRLQPSKMVLLLAMEHAFPIQPLVIEGAFEVLRSLFRPRAHFRLRVLPSIDPKEFDSMSELKHTVQQKMSDALKEQESTSKIKLSRIELSYTTYFYLAFLILDYTLCGLYLLQIIGCRTKSRTHCV